MIHGTACVQWDYFWQCTVERRNLLWEMHMSLVLQRVQVEQYCSAGSHSLPVPTEIPPGRPVCCRARALPVPARARGCLVHFAKLCKDVKRVFEVLNEVYLQNFLHRWVVNRETNLMMLINPCLINN